MEKKIIHTPLAPAPIGPYSQAVQIGDFLFISGQVALVPETGQLINDSIADETEQVMRNLQNILEKAGLSFHHVVKTSIFLLDMNNFTQVNEVYAKYFSNDFPARETIQAAKLPRNANVEISMIAAS